MWVFSSYRFKIHIHVFRSLKVILISLVFHRYYINSLSDNCNEMIEYTYFYMFFLCLYIVINHSLPFRKKLFYPVLVKHFFIPCALFFMFSDIREMEKRNPRILSLWWWPSSTFFYCFQTGTFLSINVHFPKQLENVFLALSSIWRNAL